VLDDAPRSATACAETDTETRHMSRENLIGVLEQQPGLALDLIREFSRRVRAINAKYVDEVMQAERLTLVGRFARTIVHDFKNPLTVIGLAAELACSQHTAQPMRQKAQSKIVRQIERMTNMLQELIEFTKPSGLRPGLRTVDFSRFLVPLAEEIRQELALRRVTLEWEHEPPAVEVRVEPLRLARLFHNLVNNAVDEMPEGGKIFLRFQSTAEELRIDIEDTGRGIAPEIAASLFTPFATHGKLQGTGLGLTICQRIVADHGGRIWAAASAPGKGATFCFTLPLPNQLGGAVGALNLPAVGLPPQARCPSDHR
jgi:signal transduction histidine kinase